MDQVNRYAKIQAKEKFRILQSVWLIWAWPAQIKGSVHPYEPLKYFNLRRHIGIPLRCRLDILFGDSSIQNRCPLNPLENTHPNKPRASDCLGFEVKAGLTPNSIGEMLVPTISLLTVDIPLCAAPLASICQAARQHWQWKFWQELLFVHVLAKKMKAGREGKR